MALEIFFSPFYTHVDERRIHNLTVVRGRRFGTITTPNWPQWYPNEYSFTVKIDPEGREPYLDGRTGSGSSSSSEDWSEDDDEWLIDTPKGKNWGTAPSMVIVIWFESIDVEEHETCAYDYIAIRDPFAMKRPGTKANGGKSASKPVAVMRGSGDGDGLESSAFGASLDESSSSSQTLNFNASEQSTSSSASSASSLVVPSPSPSPRPSKVALPPIPMFDPLRARRSNLEMSHWHQGPNEGMKLLRIGPPQELTTRLDGEGRQLRICGRLPLSTPPASSSLHQKAFAPSSPVSSPAQSNSPTAPASQLVAYVSKSNQLEIAFHSDESYQGTGFKVSLAKFRHHIGGYILVTRWPGSGLGHGLLYCSISLDAECPPSIC